MGSLIRWSVAQKVSKLIPFNYAVGMGVDDMTISSRKTDQRYARLHRKVDCQRAGARNRDNEPNARHRSFLYDFEAGSTRHEQKPRLFLDRIFLDCALPDQLVQCIMSSDIFANVDDLAPKAAPSGAVNRAGTLLQRLMMG